jgi:pimeloyl-ACP methyl ester carboxylesterase
MQGVVVAMLRFWWSPGRKVYVPMATFSHDEVDLYYEIHGSGPPLLMIAGLARDSQSWQPIIADLASHYRLITVDNAAHSLHLENPRMFVARIVGFPSSQG